jgi:hypothetical protein
MWAIGCPRVYETRGNTLDSPLDMTATLQPADKLSLDETISIEPDPEQAREVLLRRLPSNEPATHCPLSQSHHPNPRFRGGGLTC